jgi:hypothetical protein
MNDRENCNIPNEDEEELRRLVCEIYAELHGGAVPSEEEIEMSCAVWEYVAKFENMSALECAKRDRTDRELEKKIDAESKTLEERRRRIEDELGIPSEAQGTLDIAMDDFEWLEAKTGCKLEEIHHLFSENEKLLGVYYSNPGNEEVKEQFERSSEKFESALFKAKEHLRSMLVCQQKQSVKPAMNVPIKHTTPCARTASRASHSASRPTFTQNGGGGSGDDGDSDSSDSDPPGPGARAYHLYPLTSHSKGNKPRYLDRRTSCRCWRVAGGRWAA